MSENNGTEVKKQDTFKTLDSLDLSGGIVCDVETGICGPADTFENEKEKTEERTNENNNMV